jgi:excisionase family DNA binding protein
LRLQIQTQMDSITITNLNKADLKTLIVECMQSVIAGNGISSASKDYLTTEEVTALFKISRTTLHNWQKSKKIPFHKIQRRVYFKPNEIEDALQKFKSV